MAMECKVCELHNDGTASLADDIAKLQANRDTYFVEEDGDLVEGHGVFVGDEFDLWPSYSDDTVSDVAQWFTDIVGIPVVSHTADRVYSPAS
jgi:hypothetical protein